MNPAHLGELLKNKYRRTFEVIEKEGTYSFSIKTEHGEASIDFTKLYAFVDNLKPSHLTYNVMIGLDSKTKITAGFAFKEYKRIGITEYELTDPLTDIYCYTDENMVILSDENDNLLIV